MANAGGTADMILFLHIRPGWIIFSVRDFLYSKSIFIRKKPDGADYQKKRGA